MVVGMGRRGEREGKKRQTDTRPPMDKRTDRHTHTRQNLYILATRAVITIINIILIFTLSHTKLQDLKTKSIKLLHITYSTTSSTAQLMITQKCCLKKPCHIRCLEVTFCQPTCLPFSSNIQ